MTQQADYILLTAAKNEEAYIGEAISGVLRQSLRPAAWFIMDDGSTDRTATLVEDFARNNPFIHLVKREAATKRNFGAQYRAVQAGYELARPLNFGFAGFQDADIAPQSPDYYETILKKFQENPKLGIAGGYIYERDSENQWRCRTGNSEDSVAGGIQMFRRACFERIGGYTPLPYGGADWLAQIDASMTGWESVAFPDLPVLHYRPTSSADGRLRGQFHLGLMDGSFGAHPVFEAFKCARRIGVKPFIVAAAVRFCGYAWWNLRGRKPLIPSKSVDFLRGSQLIKIRRFATFQR